MVVPKLSYPLEKNRSLCIIYQYSKNHGSVKWHQIGGTLSTSMINGGYHQQKRQIQRNLGKLLFIKPLSDRHSYFVHTVWIFWGVFVVSWVAGRWFACSLFFWNGDGPGVQPDGQWYVQQDFHLFESAVKVRPYLVSVLLFPKQFILPYYDQR